MKNFSHDQSSTDTFGFNSWGDLEIRLENQEKIKPASKEGISVKLIPSSMDEQTIRLFSAFVDTAEFNELLMDENNGQIVVSCAHWIKEVNKMIQLKSNFETKKAQLTKRMLDANTNKAKLENESSNFMFSWSSRRR